MTESDSQYTVRVAVADIGANSVRMNIYDVDVRDGSYKTVTGARSMLGLAAYVKNGALDRDGEGKLYTVVRDFLTKSNGYLCDEFMMFATASLRGLSNGKDITDKIKEKFGVEVEIISGEREAQLDFRAIKYKFSEKMSAGAAIDMGGGSTEIIAYREGGEVVCSESTDIGCLMLVREFISGKGNLFPDDAQSESIRNYVRNTLDKYPALRDTGREAFLIGGTARAVFALTYAVNGKKNAPEEGACLSVAQIRETYEKIKHGSPVIKKTVPERVRTVLPGLIAYLEIFAYLGTEKLTLSLSGVREGYFFGYLTERKYLKFQEF